MKSDAFLPRSESKSVFVLVMVCYALATAAFVRTLAAAFGAPRPPEGLFVLHGRPTARVSDLLLFAPIIESLILIGAIELSRLLHFPTWLQITVGAMVIGFLHSVLWRPWGFIVAPGFAIQGIAYVIWKRASWMTAFGIVACIHALLNLIARHIGDRVWHPT